MEKQNTTPTMTNEERKEFQELHVNNYEIFVRDNNWLQKLTHFKNVMKEINKEENQIESNPLLTNLNQPALLTNLNQSLLDFNQPLLTDFHQPLLIDFNQPFLTDFNQPHLTYFPQPPLTYFPQPLLTDFMQPPFTDFKQDSLSIPKTISITPKIKIETENKNKPSASLQSPETHHNSPTEPTNNDTVLKELNKMKSSISKLENTITNEREERLKLENTITKEREERKIQIEEESAKLEQKLSQKSLRVYEALKEDLKIVNQNSYKIGIYCYSIAARKTINQTLVLIANKDNVTLVGGILQVSDSKKAVECGGISLKKKDFDLMVKSLYNLKTIANQFVHMDYQKKEMQEPEAVFSFKELNLKQIFPLNNFHQYFDKKFQPDLSLTEDIDLDAKIKEIVQKREADLRWIKFQKSRASTQLN